MKRSDVIRTIQVQFKHMRASDAAAMLDTVVDSMISAISNGNRIEIRGFGSFKIKNYGGYTGRNPKTGANVSVPEKRLPCFRAGKELKDFLNTSAPL